MAKRMTTLLPGRALVLGMIALGMIALASPAPAGPLQPKAEPPAEEAFEEPPPIPIFSWGGAYAGLHAGYAFGRDRALLAAPLAGSARQRFTTDGVIGGGHAGYNLVTGVSLDKPVGVFGVEADIDGSSLGRRAAGVFAGPAGTAYAFTPAISDVRSRVVGSIRGRAGVGVQRLLFYGTGGLAIANISSAVPGVADGRSDVTRLGYTLGAGLEYAMTNHLALRAEYRYSDYGRTTDAGAAVAFPGAVLSHNEEDARLQGGFSYLLSDPVPVSRTD